MPAFKAYLLVIKKNIPSLMIYFFVFVAMAVLFIKVVGNQGYSDFSSVKSNLILINEEDTRFADGLAGYLAESANIISVGDDEQSIRDALFFGKADCVLKIPAGFTESFTSGSDGVALEKTAGTLSSGAVNIDVLTERYLSLAQLYINNVPGISQESIVASVRRDLGVTAPVDMHPNVQQAQTSKQSDVFRYLAYPILAIMFMGVTSIMLAFNGGEISRRSSCAPLGPVKFNMQLFIGNALFTVIVWGLLCVVSLAVSGDAGLTPGILLLWLNAFIAAVMALTIAFLAGQFIRSYIAQAALTNVISLGLAFISGIFLPQYLLGQTVLKIASFTPYFWYVKAVDTIGALPSYGFDDIKQVLGYMLIQLGFAAAFIIIALVAGKQKKIKRAS